MGRKNVEEGKLMTKLDSTGHLLTIAISMLVLAIFSLLMPITI
jgi:hypothetical protein